jgi:hypothetical protein
LNFLIESRQQRDINLSIINLRQLAHYSDLHSAVSLTISSSSTSLIISRLPQDPRNRLGSMFVRRIHYFWQASLPRKNVFIFTQQSSTIDGIFP